MPISLIRQSLPFLIAVFGVASCAKPVAPPQCTKALQAHASAAAAEPADETSPVYDAFLELADACAGLVDPSCTLVQDKAERVRTTRNVMRKRMRPVEIREAPPADQQLPLPIAATTVPSNMMKPTQINIVKPKGETNEEHHLRFRECCACKRRCLYPQVQCKKDSKQVSGTDKCALEYLKCETSCQQTAGLMCSSC